jgi:hypothetical protein
MRKRFNGHPELLMHPYEVFDRFGVEVKPCPFCGSHYVALYMSHILHVTCIDCGADGPQAEVNDMGGSTHPGFIALERWNLRAHEKIETVSLSGHIYPSQAQIDAVAEVFKALETDKVAASSAIITTKMVLRALRKLEAVKPDDKSANESESEREPKNSESS